MFKADIIPFYAIRSSHVIFALRWHRSLCTLHQEWGLQVTSLPKEAVPRKAQSELAGYSGEGSSGGKDSPVLQEEAVVSSCGHGDGSLLMNNLDSVWGSIFKFPSLQELIGPNTAGSSPSPRWGFGLGIFCLVTNYYSCIDGQLGAVIIQSWECFILPFQVLVYLFKKFGVWPPQAWHMYVYGNLWLPVLTSVSSLALVVQKLLASNVFFKIIQNCILTPKRPIFC